MDRTYRDIIDAFNPPLPGSYTPTRLAPGTFTGEVPGYLGLLTREAAKSQVLTFNLPPWDGISTDPAAPDVLTISIRPLIDLNSFASISEEHAYFQNTTFRVPFNISVTDPSAPVVVRLAETMVPNGIWLLRADLEITDSGAANWTVPQLLIVDETAPYERTSDWPPAPDAPAGLTVPLDRAYFQSQPNQTVNFPIPYDQTAGRSPGDTVQVFFGSNQRPIATLPIDPSVPGSIPLSLANILAEQNSNYDLSYRIVDASGNRSEQSYKLTLTDVGQAPVPADFLPPEVLLAVPGDGLIHRRDVVDNNGAIVRVPSYTNVDRTVDQIIVTLTSVNGSIPLTLPVGTAAFPMPFEFTQANMTTLYGAGPGRVPVTASYVVLRGANTYPATPLSVPFDLDLSVAGPNPNPNPPGPDGINDDLFEVIVEAIRPGNTFGPPNHLQVADVNRDARARIPLWTAAVVPDLQLPFTITLVYGTRVYTQNVTAIPPGREVTFTIPFADIRTLGGPTQDAYYTVSRAGNPNPQRSTTTLVTVDSAFLQMDAPTFPDIVPHPITGFRNANCDALRPIDTGNLRLNITGSAYLSPSVPVRVTFTGFQNNTNTPPSVMTFIRDFSVPSDNAGVIGFTVDLGTALELYNPINTSRAFLSAASATVTVSTQFQGQTVTSLPATVRIRGYRPGNVGPIYCSGGLIP
ncbi:hypothetical protein [Pseudomonas sp.]|uniref:hypothetical protein n=1 Tax=Pseudomonas sp. TaxID=306 RepID=UPI003C4CAD66